MSKPTTTDRNSTRQTNNRNEQKHHVAEEHLRADLAALRIKSIPTVCRDGSGEVALILVKAGADLRARNNEGKRKVKTTLFLDST